MRHLWVNIALLILLAVQLVSGYLGFTNGQIDNRWLLWIHGIGAYSIGLILVWKGAVILNAYRRRSGLSAARVLFAGMIILLLLTLLSGLIWTTTGPYYLFGFSLITLHIFVALALSSLAIWHLVKYRWIFRSPRAVNRRSFTKISIAATSGLVAWFVANRSKRILALPGIQRRFTGSYETGSYSGNFPMVSWIADAPPLVDLNQYQFQVSGEVQRTLHFNFAELQAYQSVRLSAVLDCTGGWYSEQIWQGIPVGKLLELAGLTSDANSVTFKSITGYARRFSLKEAAQFLLATSVAGRPLSSGHGFPVRLVAPGQRGVYWVKWIDAVTVNRTGVIFQTPLPLQ